MIVAFIRYEIDPFKRDGFETYAKTWGRIIPRCGGALLGYFMPHEGTNYVAQALVGFANLAGYEAYRAKIKSDPEGAANLAFAQREKFILKEERQFLTAVEGTMPQMR